VWSVGAPVWSDPPPTTALTERWRSGICGINT
jgi:hypothetical protein